MSDSSSIERRIRLLEDLEAIGNVTVRYANAINKCGQRNEVDAEAITSIFAPDARWHSDEFGAVVGADAIAAGLLGATAKVEFSMHTFLNPTITVDGEKASAS